MVGDSLATIAVVLRPLISKETDTRQHLMLSRRDESSTTVAAQTRSHSTLSSSSAEERYLRTQSQLILPEVLEETSVVRIVIPVTKRILESFDRLPGFLIYTLTHTKDSEKDKDTGLNHNCYDSLHGRRRLSWRWNESTSFSSRSFTCLVQNTRDGSCADLLSININQTQERFAKVVNEYA